MIHAFALENPNNTVKVMGREITRKLTEWGHKEVVFVGGDPTSQKEDVKQEKGHDFFRLIISELQPFNPRRAVLPSSPSVRMSADFFNSILEGEIFGITFGVDKSLRKVILDFENTKEDKNGKVDKTTVTNPATKVTYQPYGHFVDLTRYFLCYTFAPEYAKYQKGGITHLPITGNNRSKNSW